MNTPIFWHQSSLRPLLCPLIRAGLVLSLLLPFVVSVSVPVSAPVSAIAAGQPAGRSNDIYIGNMHEGIVIENDPDTGDSIMQVTPPPQPEGQAGNQGNVNTIIIAPEVKVPQQNTPYGPEGRPDRTDRPRHP